jgi:hypothetical protein
MVTCGARADARCRDAGRLEDSANELKVSRSLAPVHSTAYTNVNVLTCARCSCLLTMKAWGGAVQAATSRCGYPATVPPFRMLTSLQIIFQAQLQLLLLHDWTIEQSFLNSPFTGWAALSSSRLTRAVCLRARVCVGCPRIPQLPG